jgi:hypothetical protein
MLPTVAVAVAIITVSFFDSLRVTPTGDNDKDASVLDMVRCGVTGMMGTGNGNGTDATIDGSGVGDEESPMNDRRLIGVDEVV